jgi:hypothetical protein
MTLAIHLPADQMLSVEMVFVPVYLNIGVILTLVADLNVSLILTVPEIKHV